MGFTFGAVFVTALPAGAAPPGSAAATPPKGSLDQQISDASSQLEIVVEQYDAIRVSLGQTKAKEATLTKQLIPLHQAVETARAKVGRLAAGVYETDAFGTFGALVDASSVATALNRLGELNELARNRQAQINALYASASVFTQQQAKLAALDSAQTNTYATLKSKKSTIISQISTLKSMRLAAYGVTGLPAAPPISAFVPTYVAGIAAQVVKFAVAQVGKMYRWAAAGPDHYDCSGLTMAAWKTAGVALPHNAALQYRTIAHVTRAKLQPGDLVFYFNPVHHVALYVGDDRVIQAPEMGQPVSLANIDLAPIHGYGRP